MYHMNENDNLTQIITLIFSKEPSQHIDYQHPHFQSC
jgi:hypothetical protein